MKSPKISVDILVLKNNKILLGLLTKHWMYEGKQAYGVPGRDVFFGEKISDTVERNIKEEFNCHVTTQSVICVNANYANGNHYIGIGILATINGEPQVLAPQDWETWEWFEKNSLPDNLFPAAKNLIECYLQNKISIAD